MIIIVIIVSILQRIIIVDRGYHGIKLFMCDLLIVTKILICLSFF